MPPNKKLKGLPFTHDDDRTVIHIADRRDEAGNALLFVLIGIVLFAALTFTMSSGFRTEGTDRLSDRKAELAVSEILDYGARLQRAVDRIRRNGCSESDISFANSTVSGYEHDPEVDDKCKIFHPAGGGLSWKTPNPEYIVSSFEGSGANFGQYHFPYGTCIYGVGDEYDFTGNGNCNANDQLNEDLIMILPYAKENICSRINKKTGVTAESIPVEESCVADHRKFTGSYNGSCEAADAQDGPLYSKHFGCIQQGTGGNYPTGANIVYYVLMAR